MHRKLNLMAALFESEPGSWGEFTKQKLVLSVHSILNSKKNDLVNTNNRHEQLID